MAYKIKEKETRGEYENNLLRRYYGRAPVLKAAKRKDGYDFGGVFAYTKKLMEQSDFVVGNLETPLAGKQTNTNPCFNAPDEYVDALLDAGVKLVSTANSHTFDCGYEGCKIASGNPSTAKATTADSFSQMIFLKENEEVCGHLKNYIDYVDSEVPVLEGQLGLFDAEEN